MLPANCSLSRSLHRALALGSLRCSARHYVDAAPVASGSAQMAFTFASPSEVFYNAANVKQVDIPTLSESFGILAAHVPTLQVLKPGVVAVFTEDGSAAKYFVSSGSITVNADPSDQLLAEEVVQLDHLDLAVAKSNLEKALLEFASASDETAKAEAQIRVEANEAPVEALDRGGKSCCCCEESTVLALDVSFSSFLFFWPVQMMWVKFYN